MQGIEFLRRMAELHPSCFRILLTGHATVGSTLTELTSRLVEQLLTKPWTAATMDEALRHALVTRSRLPAPIKLPSPMCRLLSLRRSPDSMIV